jgi:ribosomal protein L34
MSLVGRKVLQRRRQLAKENALRHILCERLARGRRI